MTDVEEITTYVFGEIPRHISQKPETYVIRLGHDFTD